MTRSELDQIVESLKLTSKEKMIDDAFKYFIDNQINTLQLKYILDCINYTLPDYFFNLSIDKQKTFHCHTKRLVLFTNKGIIIKEDEIFNSIYFYELAYASKKNKSITKVFINYSRKLDNLPLHFLTMKYVRLKNLDYAINHGWVEFAGKYKITNLYDFYMKVVYLPNSLFKTKLLSQLYSFFKIDTLFNLDMNLPFVKFSFDIESLLASPRLNHKIANTIKIKFLVYKSFYLKDNEYNKTLENPRTLINKHRDSFSTSKLKELSKYYSSDDYKILNSFNDNGYRVIYYSILEEFDKK